MPRITHRTIPLFAVYLANILLSLHYYLIIYTNSSLLSNSLEARTIGALYIGGSLLTLVFMLSSARIIAFTGMYRFLFASVIAEGVATVALALAHSPVMLGTAFVLHQLAIVMILLSLDVYLETLIMHEGHTGLLRSGFLTVSSAALVASPFIASFFISGDVYTDLYALSALILIPLLLLLLSIFRSIKVRTPRRARLGASLREFWQRKKLVSVSIPYLALHIFYALMVVYMPVYLHTYIGFEWSALGMLFTIMLLPFLLFEIPVGRIADEKLGEKEFMIIGLIVIAITMFLVPMLRVPSFGAWALLLFMSRVGASFVEVTTESYFFKQVDGADEHLISIFRSLHVFSYIVGTTIAITVIYLMPFQYMFTVAGCIILLGILGARTLKDTK